MKVKVLGTGSHVPEKILSNAELEKLVDTEDSWIVERTGIRTRHVVVPGENTSDLAAKAAERALEAAGVKAAEIDTLILATSTPDRVIPPASVYVQKQLGCWDAAVSDLTAACSGFTYALTQGRALVSSGQSKRCLLVGAETLTRVTNYKDRGTCVLFGDGAGAVVLGPSDGESDILYTKMGCDGRLEDLITTPTFGTALPTTAESLEQGQQFIRMKGREVYKFAVPKFVEIIREGLKATGLSAGDLKWLIPHQMNARMIEAVAGRLDFPMDRVLMNIENYGNTSAASIPLVLDEAVRAGKIRRGDLLLMSAMGAGITWGTVVLRW